MTTVNIACLCHNDRQLSKRGRRSSRRSPWEWSGGARLWLVTAVLLGALTAPALAHDFTITETTLFVRADQRFQVDMICDLDALLLGAGSGHDPDELVRLIEEMAPEDRAARLERLGQLFLRRVRVRVDGERVPFRVVFPDRVEGFVDSGASAGYFGVTARLVGELPETARTISFWASRAFAAVHLTAYVPGLEGQRRMILQVAEESPRLPLSREVAVDLGLGEAAAATGEGFLSWARLGFVHILPAGLDHVLFVAALALGTRQWRPLVALVTTFTVAHSLTLALASLGWVPGGGRLIEIAIAASIVFLAVENLFEVKLGARLVVVFSFGLLHGLGFASVLGELLSPGRSLLVPLLGFNVGVELGQLLVVGLIAASIHRYREADWLRQRVVVPGSLAIAAVGLYWALERMLT